MPPVQDITTRKKKWWYYLPYLPVLCFISEVVGVAIWDVNTRAAVKAIRNCLQILGLQVDTALVWSSEALAFTVALIILFGLCMLALGAGRSVIAYQADRTGATRMGGRLIAWMWLDAIFIVLWFLLTLWLLLLLLGECLWMAASWGLNTAIQVGAGSARANAAAGNNLTIPHANATAGDCFMACVDLYEFEWALSNNTCFCTLNAVEPADAAMQEALGKMAGSVTGAVLLLISGMWVLMAAASEFGVTRRERQLLRRIAKARMASNIEVAKLLPNGGSGSGIVGFGSKKNKGNKSTAALGQPGPAMLVDPETGEVLDVENTPDPRPVPASASNTSLPDGLKRSGSLAKGARALGKGLAKGGKIFDMMGSFLSPGRR